LILLNPFELFFDDPTKSKLKYENIFSVVKTILNDEESTKLTVYSHHTNIDDIRD